jgi:hypothetical protein
MDDVVPEPAVIAEAPVLGAHEASVPAMEEVPVEESAEGTETFPAPADVAETAAEDPLQPTQKNPNRPRSKK